MMATDVRCYTRRTSSDQHTQQKDGHQYNRPYISETEFRIRATCFEIYRNVFKLAVANMVDYSNGGPIIIC